MEEEMFYCLVFMTEDKKIAAMPVLLCKVNFGENNTTA
jgi:hypothetical protein